MPAPVRCAVRRRRAAAVLPLALALALGASAAGTLPAAASVPAAGPLQDAVVSVAPGAALPGVELVRTLPGLDAAVVRGTAPALSRLASAPGVRGVAEDVPLTVTGETSSAPAVLASEGLAAPAGQPGAGRGVRVAVVDTGVGDTPALSRAAGRLVDGVDASDPARVLTGPAAGPFDDGHGHGTHMATVLAGGPVVPGGPAVGVAPGATVVVVKVADETGATSLSRVLTGLDWVVRNKHSVDVVNLALAAERPGDRYGRDPLVDAVARVRAAGVPAVVATGNQADRVADPGFDPRGLSVGAADTTTDEVSVAAFSGSDVVAGVRRPDVVASGVGVLGAVPAGSVIDQGTPDRPDGLVRGSGTSQATAVVSGAVALLLAEHPGARPDQVRAALTGLAVDLPGERDGAGLLRIPDGTPPAAPAKGRGLTGPGRSAQAPAPAASSWGASSWGASSWGASSWGASSWGASSWGASSWGASSWGASSWGASSWGASSWGASSWGASSWGTDAWGDE